jgi:hypothetical protein
MQKQSLGRLQKVDLRDVWENESGDFTPWLAKEDNLSLLGEMLDLDLELEKQEKGVGPFRADILCKDINTQHWVLIENQIERTDHNHLGQLLTYAAGLKAVTIVWVASQFTDEHRAALDWLNEMTEESINFFGLEIEIWKIGDSPPAPRFNVVSKPNTWTSTVSQVTRAIVAGNLTETKKLQLDYWTEFSDFLKRRKSVVHPQRPSPQHWMNFAIGRANIYMNGFVNTKEKRIGVVLVMGGPDSKAFYHLLERERSKIDAELGSDLVWRELPGKTESHIALHHYDCDPFDRPRWQEYMTWMAENLEKFYRVFGPRVRLLNPSDYDPGNENPALEILN